MTIDDIRAALLEPGATLASLTSAADAARALAAAAADDVAQLDARRPAVLLNGTAKDLAKLDEAVAGANRTAERAGALAEACATRAADRQAAEAERARSERFAAAETASAELAKTMSQKYRRLVAVARELLTDIGTARSLVEAANRDLPEGRAALDHPESFRAPPSRDRIVEEEVLSVWCHEDGTPVPLERQADIAEYGRPGRGRFRPGAAGKQSEEEFHRSDVVRLVVRPGRGAFRFEPFDVALAIPPLMIDGPPGWSLHFHALRHFAAWWWIHNGMPLPDVARLMGHSKVDMTLSVYTHSLTNRTGRSDMVDRMSSTLTGLPTVIDGALSPETVAP